jgi:hypothetical protein
MDLEVIRSTSPHRLAHRVSSHALVALFAAVAARELAHHEMWLDELNPWVIARDAHSLRELFYNMRFEPHPPVWYLCLYALTRITRHPAAMQVLHGAIGTASVALLAYVSPFRRRDVWLMAFGYYLLFEYCAISRGYALGILLAMTCCWLAATPRPRVVAIAVLLALLANTSVFGLIIACALVVALSPTWRTAPRSARAIAIVVFLCGIGLSVWALLPAPQNVFGRDRTLQWSTAHLDYVTALLGVAYLPLPDFSNPSPWNSSLLVTAGRRIPTIGHFAPLAAGGVVFVLALVRLRRSPHLAAAFAGGSVVMLALMYVEYSGGYRHQGHLFVLLLIVMWLDAAARRDRAAIPVWFSFILAVHVVAGVYFAAIDASKPFSWSKDVARFLAAQPHDVPVVVAQPDFLSFLGPPISGYLQQRIYYAMPGGVVRGSYLWYDEMHARGAGEALIVDEITRFARDRSSDVFVVVSHWDSPLLGARVAEFLGDTIEGDERHAIVYRFKKPT